MTPISSKVVQIVLVIAALVCGAITASYGGVGEAIGVSLIVLAIAASPRKGSAVLLDMLSNMLSQVSMALRKISELIEPRKHEDKNSMYQTEYFFDDQGIRIELCNLNCTVTDRRRLGDFAHDFVLSMIHQPPVNGNPPSEESTTLATGRSSSLRGDTRRMTAAESADELATTG